MSLILDALKRSQEERSDMDSVPGLATRHYPDSTATGNNWLQGLPWLALLIALVTVGWLLLERKTVPEPEALPLAVVVQRELPATTPKEPTAASPPPGEKIEPAVPRRGESPNAEVAALYERDGAVPEPGRASAEPASQPAPVVPSTVATGTEVESGNQTEQTIDIEQLVLEARQGIAEASLDEHPAPFISDLSQVSKDAIPSLMYSRHDFDGQGGSSIVLNGKTLRQGDSVTGGVKVDEIHPDFVVLSHGGTQFRLKALNSWVNL